MLAVVKRHPDAQVDSTAAGSALSTLATTRKVQNGFKPATRSDKCLLLSGQIRPFSAC